MNKSIQYSLVCSFALYLLLFHVHSIHLYLHFTTGNWVDVNYIIPTGPQTCDIVFDWYLDKDVYPTMSKSQIEQAISDRLVSILQ